ELRLHDAFDGTLSRVDADGKTTVVLASPLLKNAGNCTFGPTGDLYVLSWERGGVVKLDAAGKELGIVKSGRDENTFRWPRAFTVSPDRDLLVVDGRGSRVFCYDADLKFRWRLDPQDAANGRSRSDVTAVRVDRAGKIHLLSADDGCVWTFDRERKPVTTLRPDEKRLGTLRHPGAMDIDADGTIYVADTGNNRIVVLETRIPNPGPDPEPE
ncbi:MAG TPA: hypothetical protein VMX57_07015, partial [Planctomycetota bacterium]|nr:hypothetical protein [Planctomycetota bacterium]